MQYSGLALFRSRDITRIFRQSLFRGFSQSYFWNRRHNLMPKSPAFAPDFHRTDRPLCRKDLGTSVWQDIVAARSKKQNRTLVRNGYFAKKLFSQRVGVRIWRVINAPSVSSRGPI